MCGIVGYIGYRQAQPILFNNLARLEYRGYDSCGIAIKGSKINIVKDVVRVKELAVRAPKIKGTVGIGHTRWATCGIPSKKNAHPHSDCNGKIAVVHNGVIFNYNEIKTKLEGEGHDVSTQTDSEVLAHLIESNRTEGLSRAFQLALQEIDGSYAVLVIDKENDKLLAAKKESPMVIGLGEREYFVASDVPALLDYTDRVIFLEDGDTVEINKNGFIISNNGTEIERKEQKILWSIEDAHKGGYEHFMIKEIHEQPQVLRNTLSSCIRGVEKVDLLNERVCQQIIILACGTSYHAGMTCKYVIEEMLEIPVEVKIASEFTSKSKLIDNTVGIAISQSGETADVLKAAKTMKNMGYNVLAITNVMGSSLSRLVNDTIYTKAGPEISVASTKTFMAQLTALYWLAISNARINIEHSDELRMIISRMPDRIQQILNSKSAIEKVSKKLACYERVFYIGRGVNYPIALEGALKLKEISYIHAEGYPAGELKHGPFALLGADTIVVAVVANDDRYEAMLNGIREIKARKSPVIAICTRENVADLDQIADIVIETPCEDPIFSPFCNCLVVQLLAYYSAREKGCSIDYPKNLAKSVTVE